MLNVSLAKTEQNTYVKMNKGFLQGFFSLRLILVPPSHIFQDIRQFLFHQVLVLKPECSSTLDCSKLLTLYTYFFIGIMSLSSFHSCYENTLK